MKDIYFLLTPRYLALDFVGPAEAFRMALDECLSLHRIASWRPRGSALG